MSSSSQLALLGGVAMAAAVGLLLFSGGCYEPEGPTTWSGATRKTDWLTMVEATERATALANEAFAGKVFTDRRSGRTVRQVKLSARDWTKIDKVRDRWQFECDPDVGPQAEVSFNMTGRDVDVDVGYDFD